MSNQIISILYPALLTILTGVAAYLGKEIVKIVPKVIEFVVAKIGLTNYQKTKAIAWDIWNVVEEHFRISQYVGDKVKAKTIMFETLIKQKIPGITDAEIEAVRQAIAGEFNKDKPVVEKIIEDTPTATESQAVNVVSVKPIIKYVTPDGTELKPVESTTPVNDSTDTNTPTADINTAHGNTVPIDNAQTVTQ